MYTTAVNRFLDISATEAVVTVMTQPLAEGRSPNGTLQMTYSIDKMYESNTTFSYVDDPVIESIDKMKSFVRYLHESNAS